MVYFLLDSLHLGCFINNKYRNTLFYCTSCYCMSKILYFLQTKVKTFYQQRLWLTLWQYSLYCGSLKLNQQYLQGMLIITVKVIFIISYVPKKCSIHPCVFKISLWNMYHCPHFTYGKTGSEILNALLKIIKAELGFKCKSCWILHSRL